MKAIIEVDVEKIRKIDVTPALLDSMPELKKATEKAIEQISGVLEMYLNDKKIDCKVTYRMEYG